MLAMRLWLILGMATTPEPATTPTPTPIRGFILRPGYAYDRATGEYRPLPTPTRLPRVSAETIKPCVQAWEGTVAYRDCDVETVIGVVRDVEESAGNNRNPTSLGSPLVLLDVEEAFPADPGSTVLFRCRASRGTAPGWRAGGQGRSRAGHPASRARRLSLGVRTPAVLHWPGAGAELGWRRNVPARELAMKGQNRREPSEERRR